MTRLVPFTHAEFDAAVAVIRQRTNYQPTVGLILGSGLGKIADAVQTADIIPYSDISNWPHSSVPGHSNRLVIGKLEGQDVIVMQGRSHYYEGYSLYETTFPVRIMQKLAIKTLIVTNAAGGVNTSFKAGDIMLITDHINLLGMVGNNPLIGPDDEALGKRFPDMSQAYDRELCALARRTAAQLGLTLREGVYACLSGPTFETPAEVRMLRGWGVDAVGMSTVPEVIVARHDGKIRVMGISGISNMTNDGQGSAQEVSHLDVLETGEKIIAPKLIPLIQGVLAGL